MENILVYSNATALGKNAPNFVEYLIEIFKENNKFVVYISRNDDNNATIEIKHFDNLRSAKDYAINY